MPKCNGGRSAYAFASADTQFSDKIKDFEKIGRGGEIELGRRGRPKASQQRAWKIVVNSSRKNLSMIERLSEKRGWDSGKRVDNLLRQQRNNYKEIIDFYRTRPNGSLDKRAKDFVVLIVTGNGSYKLIKIISEKAKSVIRGMILRRVSERAGYNQLVKLEKSGVFRIVTFDVTSSEGSKRHKEERNRQEGRKNPEKILVIESGERTTVILNKLRKIEGIKSITLNKNID